MLNLDMLLSEVSSVGISGHIRPDGDCIGSCLGMYLFIQKYYPSVETDIYLEEIPEKYRFLKGSDKIISAGSRDKKYDLFICLDCGDPGRLGANAVFKDTAEKTACIDHHITNNAFAMYNQIVPEASSTSELVADLIGTDRIDYDMAQALYLGMVHDTGVFQYSCTSSHTMALAGALMDKGIPFSRIVADTFFTKTFAQQKAFGRAAGKAQLVMNGSVILSSITMKDRRDCGAAVSDLDGISAQLRDTEGVHLSIFIYELAPEDFKVSMRSDDTVDVSVIASCFGGGGHKKAAGCDVAGTESEVFEKLLEKVKAQTDGEP